MERAAAVLMLVPQLLACAAMTPPIQVSLNMNNVVGQVQKPGEDYNTVHFLGEVDSIDACARACLQYQGAGCLSFTYHTLAFGGDLARHCYGYINDPMWSPIAQDNIHSGRILWPCRSDMDCSLNGRCMPDGECFCRAAWRGHRCHRLNLEPVRRGTGYHYMEGGKNISSWGGAVQRHEDGTYHMYLAEMKNHCGINSWTLNSQVVHAAAKDPVGTYERQGVVWPPFAHEPDIARGPNGEFVIYWAGNHYNWPVCNCTDGSTNPDCKELPFVPEFFTLMSYATDPAGPWSKPVSLLGPKRTCDTNFAPVILKDGSLVGFDHYCWVNGSRLHLVTATNWKDPATYRENPEQVWPFMPAGGAEDPYMYLDGDGNFHALFHNLYPNFLPDNCGGHAYSKDGKNWTFGGMAYHNLAHFADGTTFSFGRRERPHFVFAEDGVIPIALTNGVQYGGQYGDAVYTLLQEVST